VNPKFLGDLAFLREYKVVMSPVAAALDILQGEERAYMGLLLPTIASLLNAFAEISGLEHCSPLHKSLVQGIKNR